MVNLMPWIYFSFLRLAFFKPVFFPLKGPASLFENNNNYNGLGQIIDMR
jgi:hypothetical protein